MLSVEEAHARLTQGIAPLAPEIVALSEGLGRVLRAPVMARRTQPPTPISAMDGYAVRAADIAAPGRSLRCVGAVAAGEAFTGTIGPGEAVRIFTGAGLPAGADTVVAQEDCESDSTTEEIRFTIAGERGRHVRPAGLDFAAGDTVLSPPLVLSPADLALAAAAGADRLKVSPEPHVAILATGTELIRPDEVGTDRDGPTRTVASSLYGLAAAVRQWGAVPLDLGIAPDDRTRLEAALKGAGDSDLVITLGGASVGDHDLVQEVVTAMGGTIDFWRIAMRPGKPLMVGSLMGRPFIGLPGNPVSALVCAELFVRAAIDRLRGLDGSLPPLDTARCGAPTPQNGPRQDYMRAELSRDADGTLVATPFPVQDSSMLTSHARAHALLVRPPHAPALEPGAPCPVLPLRNLTNSKL